jgi:hypothetical protein
MVALLQKTDTKFIRLWYTWSADLIEGNDKMLIKLFSSPMIG